MNTTTKTILALALATCLAPTAQAQAQGMTVRPADDTTSRLTLDQMRKERLGSFGEKFDRKRNGAESLLRPVIGVVLSPDDVAGVRISGVTPGGGSAKAGLKPGDRIVVIDGRQLQGSSGTLRLHNAQKLLSRLEAGSPVRIGYVRDGKPASIAVTPQIDQTVYLVRDDGSLLRADGNVQMLRDRAGRIQVTADRIDNSLAPGVAPEVRREIIRIGPGIACKGNECDMPALMSAFRWNGLNLASVDKQLGRYFGTDQGVLVLSNGELAGLQAGDVIQRIDGKPVSSPREAMAAMGNKPGGAKVTVDYLRDRKAGKAQVTVPKLAPLPLPPAPPAPPAPPTAPKAPPPPPAPPAPQAAAPSLPPGPPMAPAAPRPPAVPDGAGMFTLVADDGPSVSFAWNAGDATPVDVE
ncbi:PDZ domain-containing protein [Luteimonas mephitis]|uniref:PDZ domain-containing protein n=1 Tax=Luteimonas mephitis TaxID=83615 RepID=UPI00040C9316|nr:PDZ domain-containing protein [Luteimonas mephitis]